MEVCDSENPPLSLETDEAMPMCVCVWGGLVVWGGCVCVGWVVGLIIMTMQLMVRTIQYENK